MVFQTTKDINVEFHCDGHLVLGKKKSQQSLGSNFWAEREGFEPPDAFTSTVFKTAAIDHSAISPRRKYCGDKGRYKFFFGL